MGDDGKKRKVYAVVVTRKKPELVSKYREKVLQESGIVLPQAEVKTNEQEPPRPQDTESEKKKNKKRKREEHKKVIEELEKQLDDKNKEIDDLKQQLLDKNKETEKIKNSLDGEVLLRQYFETSFQQLQTTSVYNYNLLMQQSNAQQKEINRLEETQKDIHKVCGNEKNIKMLKNFAACINNGIIPLCQFMTQRDQPPEVSEEVNPSVYLQSEIIDTGIHTPQNGVTNLT